jgi:hypothetical protein
VLLLGALSCGGCSSSLWAAPLELWHRGCSVLVLCVVAYLIGCGANMGALRGLDVAIGGGLCVREAGSCWSGRHN